VIKREGMKCVKVFKKDEVVGIIKFQGKLVVATKKGVYIYPKCKIEHRKEDRCGK
jgi:ligand-binding sensor domain-containing protein